MKKREIEIQKRSEFLNIYFVNFNGWLSSVGFRSADYDRVQAPNMYHYTHYNKYINALCGVESYKHDVLKLSIVFLRDRHEHKFMFVGEIGTHSKTYSIEETKALILDFVKKERDKKQEELNKLVNI